MYGFDLDSVWGHGKGLSDDRLQEICDKSQPIDYVELRRSTRGKGIHAWIYGSGIIEANHAEHAAVARSLLGMCVLTPDWTSLPKWMSWVPISGSPAHAPRRRITATRY